ncbi:Fic family protein [Aliifodinibius sp. S!AR15-10]|uniref:Fic family protein n=1 Tax=Aliifodinibius sp. S!AR15-10 TaxID=2950437 RepID=UPI002864033E|nr:Fic family protein [Aliifodinibius sp. S!AR15-10]MDR8393703.1 Fic family protein [Aliifodinibius sp. S!AR15-10]
MPQQPIYRVNPDRNTPWNDLPPLPIHEELYKNVEVYEQLGKAKEALALLAGRSVAIPNQALLVNSITLQEAKDSSAIENVFTTDDDLYQAFSDKKFDDAVSGSTKEVLRYREAIWEGWEYLNEHGEFDVDYFINLYQEIKETGDSIRPPFARTYIRQGGSGPNAGKRIYTPPKGKGVLEEKLQNLVEFLNDDEIPPKEPLLKMAIAHFQFEAIHPFRDGNGRAGRILNIHYLTVKGLLELPILYLSRYIIEHKQEYYDTLAGVSQRGAWEDWLLYMLRAVESTARLTYSKVNDILEAKEAVLEAIVTEKSFQRPDQLVDAIFTQPFTKVSHLTDAGIYAENTARNYLNELAEMGVLEKKVIKGRHYYQNRELEGILSY